jgi:hypothetical protein
MALPNLSALADGKLQLGATSSDFHSERRVVFADADPAVRAERAEALLASESDAVLGVAGDAIVAYAPAVYNPLLVLAAAQAEVAKLMTSPRGDMCGGKNCFDANVTAQSHPSIHALVKFLWNGHHPLYGESSAELDLGMLGVRFPKRGAPAVQDPSSELRLHTVASTGGFGAEILCSFSVGGEDLDANGGRVYVYATGWNDLFETMGAVIMGNATAPAFHPASIDGMLRAIDESTESASRALMLLTDIKTENIVVRYENDMWECKFIDFDPWFAKRLGDRGEGEYRTYGYDVAYFFNALFFANDVCRILSKYRDMVKKTSKRQRDAADTAFKKLVPLAEPVGEKIRRDELNWSEGVVKKGNPTPFLRSVIPRNDSERLIIGQLRHYGWKDSTGNSIWNVEVTLSGGVNRLVDRLLNRIGASMI